MKNCKHCGTELKGRRSKKFCNTYCKNKWHRENSKNGSLKGIHLTYLIWVDDNPGLQPSRINEDLGKHLPNTSTILGDLHDVGFIERCEREDKDYRKVFIYITQKGKEWRKIMQNKEDSDERPERNILNEEDKCQRLT